MTTVLYIVTLSVWYTLTTFNGANQIEECARLKDQVTREFTFETTCVSRSKDLLIHDKVVYL